MRHVNNGWFVVGTASPGAGVVIVATAIVNLHEHMGFEMQMHAKICAYIFDGMPYLF